MKKNFTNFISVALIITGLLVTADGFAKKLWEPYNFKLGMAVIFFFLFLYSLIHYYLVKVGETAPKKFVNTFMALTGLKMMILVAFLAAVVYTRKEEKIAFLILFCSAYFLHTANEIFWANRFVKSKPKE